MGKRKKTVLNQENTTKKIKKENINIFENAPKHHINIPTKDSTNAFQTPNNKIQKEEDVNINVSQETIKSLENNHFINAKSEIIKITKDYTQKSKDKINLKITEEKSVKKTIKNLNVDELRFYQRTGIMPQ